MKTKKLLNPPMFSMLDWVIVAIIGLSTVFGFIVGFLRSILSVFVWLSAVIVSMVMGPALTQSFASLTSSPSIQLWLSYGVVFITSLLLGFVIKLILNLFLIGRQTGGMDSLLGAVFGFIRGILLVIVLMWFALLCGVDQTGLYHQSRLAPTFSQMTGLVAQLFPSASQTAQEFMSNARSGSQGLMNSANRGGSGIGGMGGIGGGSVGGAVSSLQSGVSQVTSSIKSNLNAMNQ